MATVYSNINKNWAVTFFYRKINGQTGHMITEMVYNRPAQDLQNFVKNKSKEIIDRFDFREVRGEARELDRVDPQGNPILTSNGESLIWTETQ